MPDVRELVVVVAKAFAVVTAQEAAQEAAHGDVQDT